MVNDAIRPSDAKVVRSRNETRQDPAPVKRISSFIDLWLGEQIRMRRKALGKPLKEVADGCAISVSLLSQLERGLRSASIQTLHALARELDSPVEMFLHNITWTSMTTAMLHAPWYGRVNIGASTAARMPASTRKS